MVKNKFIYVGFYFIILQFLIIYINILLDDFILIFFLCNHISLFLAYGFLTKNIQLIKGLISVGLIPQLIYIIEFFSELFFNTNIISSTGNLFSYDLIEFIITLLIHFSTLTLAFYFTMKNKIKLSSLVYSIFYIIILFTTTILFTPKSYDLNCIFNSCGISFLQFPQILYFWIPITIIFIIMPTYYIQKLFNNN